MAIKNNYLLVSLFIVSFVTSAVLAEPLMLTAAEMQKLRHYFPTDEENTHFIWKGDPILIQLPLNQEKRIVFPTHVTFDAKSALTTDQVRVINNDKSLYLTALKPINNTRVYVTLQDTNEVLLIDLSTADQANKGTITIDVQPNNSHPSVTTARMDNVAAASTENNADVISDNDTYVTLTRFAWQQLYAPERLLTNLQGIVRAPMHTQNFISTLVYGDKVMAHPMASWTFNHQYVTAIELRNKYAHATMINLNRDLCGNWQAASAYPRTQLKPAGDKTGDSTTLFLISDKPFGDSMEVCNAHA